MLALSVRRRTATRVSFAWLVPLTLDASMMLPCPPPTCLVWLVRPLSTDASGQPGTCCTSSPCALAAGLPSRSARSSGRASSYSRSARSSSQSARSKRARSPSASPSLQQWSRTRWRSPPDTQEESLESSVGAADDASMADGGDVGGALASLSDSLCLDPKPYYWIGRPVSTLDNPNPTIFVHNRF